MRRLVALAVACLGLAVSVPVATGWTTAGAPWPGGTVTVWNTTTHAGPLRDAMRAWNGAGARVRLAPAKTRAGADVVVLYGALRLQGRADLGYRPDGANVRIGRGFGRVGATVVLAHELGHVLGLGHETRRCSLMAPTVEVGAISGCVAACRELWRCLVQSDDRRGLFALYGRRPGG